MSALLLCAARKLNEIVVGTQFLLYNAENAHFSRCTTQSLVTTNEDHLKQVQQQQQQLKDIEKKRHRYRAARVTKRKENIQVLGTAPSVSKGSLILCSLCERDLDNPRATCKGCHKISLRLKSPPNQTLVPLKRHGYGSQTSVVVPGIHPQKVLRRRERSYLPPDESILEKVLDLEVTRWGIIVHCSFEGNMKVQRVEHYDLWTTKNCFSAMMEYIKKSTKIHQSDNRSIRRLIEWVRWGLRHEEHLGLRRSGRCPQSCIDEWVDE